MTAPPATDPPPIPHASRYVCREHYRPVNWRGRGCNSCRTFLAVSRRARRSQRRQIDEWEQTT